MELPLISVIVPVYNVECYLDRCLRSLEAQTYRNIEILLINDGSTDSSPQICKDWERRDSRVRFFTKENGGLSDARNFGIKFSAGSLLTFVDSDDVIDPKCIELLYTALTKAGADISLSANLRRFTSDKELVFATGPIMSLKTYSQEEFAKEFFRLKGNRTLHYACSKLYRREMLDFDQFPKGLLNEDVEGFFKALIRAKRIAEIDNVVYWYFINPKSITESGFGDNYLNLSEVWNRVVDLAKREAPQYQAAAEYNLRRSDFTILCELIRRGDPISDRRYDEEMKLHLRRLRGNLGILLSGGMSLNRKLLMIAIALFFMPLRFIYRITHRFISTDV